MTSAVTWFVVAFNSDCQCFGNGTESLHHIRREMVDIMLLNSTAKPSVCCPCSTLGFVVYSLQLCPTCWSNAVLFFCMCLRLLACQIVSILWFLPTGFLLTQCVLAYCKILHNKKPVRQQFLHSTNWWSSSIYLALFANKNQHSPTLNHITVIKIRSGRCNPLFLVYSANSKTVPGLPWAALTPGGNWAVCQWDSKHTSSPAAGREPEHPGKKSLALVAIKKSHGDF